MRWVIAGICSVAVLFATAGQAEAFTSRQKSTLSVAASGVTEATTLATTVVSQGTADLPATLTFGTGTNAFRDSGEAVKLTVTTNLAANRVIIYTDNLNALANPQAQIDTATGIDGGGLVGVTDRAQIVPLLWVVADTNIDYTFTTATIGDDEIFITDRAHVATFTTVGSALDNQAMKRCADNVSVPNALNNGLYPQFFGGPGVNQDLCDQVSGAPIAQAQELSKNIAVVAFNCFPNPTTAVPECLVPNLATPSPADTITMSSGAPTPIYVPLGADFRSAPAQDYATSTLTLELVTQ